MQLRQLRQVQAAEAAYHFLTQDPPPASLANASPGFQQQVNALKALIDAATSSGAAQAVGPRRERYSARNAAAAQLRDNTLRGLRQMARVIAGGPDGGSLAPDFPSIVSVSDTKNVQAIIQDARSTAEHVAPYQALFIAHGMEPDFLAQLTAETDAVAALAKDAHEARGAQLSATNDIGRVLREIRRILRGLNVQVRRWCTRDGLQGNATYQTWQTLKRPHQTAVVSEAGDTTNTPGTSQSAGAPSTASTAAATAEAVKPVASAAGASGATLPAAA